jgi:hypothetical protein
MTLVRADTDTNVQQPAAYIVDDSRKEEERVRGSAA